MIQAIKISNTHIVQYIIGCYGQNKIVYWLLLLINVEVDLKEFLSELFYTLQVPSFSVRSPKPLYVDTSKLTPNNKIIFSSHAAV